MRNKCFVIKIRSDNSIKLCERATPWYGGRELSGIRLVSSGTDTLCYSLRVCAFRRQQQHRSKKVSAFFMLCAISGILCAGILESGAHVHAHNT